MLETDKLIRLWYFKWQLYSNNLTLGVHVSILALNFCKYFYAIHKMTPQKIADLKIDSSNKANFNLVFIRSFTVYIKILRI